MTRARAHGLAFLGLLVCGGPTSACPLDRLARIADEPLKSLHRKQLPVSEVMSAEGGFWEIYRRRNGALHSIVRFDLGETGQGRTRVSFVTPKEFVIVATTVKYALPLPNKVRIASTVSTRYFFCGDVVYVPALVGDDESGAQALRDAKDMKAVIFESPDVASELAGRK